MKKLDEIRAMSDSEINETLATRVMEWHKVETGDNAPGCNVVTFWHDGYRPAKDSLYDEPITTMDWSPTSDYNHAQMVLSEMTESDKRDKIVEILTEKQGILGRSSDQVWNALTATPRQLCDAILLAVGEG